MVVVDGFIAAIHSWAELHNLDLQHKCQTLIVGLVMQGLKGSVILPTPSGLTFGLRQ